MGGEGRLRFKTLPKRAEPTSMFQKQRLVFLLSSFLSKKACLDPCE
jgi:hypothetical protein